MLSPKRITSIRTLTVPWFTKSNFLARKLDFVNQGTVKVRIDVIRLGDNKYYKWKIFVV